MEIRKQLDILENDIVIEIGSGSEPYHRSNILIDKYYEDTIGYRNNYELKEDKRIIIIADAENIPFKNSSFSYSICNHVFEHLENPLLVKKELERVSDKGFIGVPSEIYDKLYDPPTHLWYVNLKNDCLFFTKKVNGINYLENYMGESFKSLYRVSTKNNSVRLMFEQFRNSFFIEYEWHNEISIEFTQDTIDARSRAELVKEYNTKVIHTSSIEKNRIISKISSLYTKKEKINTINFEYIKENIICIDCGSEMKYKQNEFSCKSCSKTYNIKNNIIFTE